MTEPQKLGRVRLGDPDADIAAGRVETFDSAEELLAELDGPNSKAWNEYLEAQRKQR